MTLSNHSQEKSSFKLAYQGFLLAFGYWGIFSKTLNDISSNSLTKTSKAPMSLMNEYSDYWKNRFQNILKETDTQTNF